MQLRTSVDGDRGRLGEGSRGRRGPQPGGLEVVAFPSEGATLRGWLYSHAEHTDAEPQRWIHPGMQGHLA